MQNSSKHEKSAHACFRFLVFVLSPFFACAVSRAQERHVSMSVTSVEQHPMISVSNLHASPIEAFLVTVDTAATNKPLTRIYYDVYLNYKHDVPILPAALKQVPLPHIVGQELPVPTMRAVIFSDGTSEGDSAWVQELVHMRRILSDRLDEVMALLQKASDQNLTREETLELLQKAWKARREATRDATPDERVRQDQIFYTTMRNLEDRRRPNGTSPEFSLLLKHFHHTLGLWLADLEGANPPLRLRPRPKGPGKEADRTPSPL